MTARDRTGAFLVNAATLTNVLVALYVPLISLLVGMRTIQDIRLIDYFGWVFGVYVAFNVASALIRPDESIYAHRDKLGSWFVALVIWLTTAFVLIPQLAELTRSGFASAGFAAVKLPAWTNTWLVWFSAFALFDVLVLQHAGRREKYGLNRTPGAGEHHEPVPTTTGIPAPFSVSMGPSTVEHSPTRPSVSPLPAGMTYYRLLNDQELRALAATVGVIAPIPLDGWKLIIRSDGGAHIATPANWMIPAFNDTSHPPA